MFVCLAGYGKALYVAAATVSALVELVHSAGTMYRQLGKKNSRIR
jgi:hypothetical protein